MFRFRKLNRKKIKRKLRFVNVQDLGDLDDFVLFELCLAGQFGSKRHRRHADLFGQTLASFPFFCDSSDEFRVVVRQIPHLLSDSFGFILFLSLSKVNSLIALLKDFSFENANYYVIV